MYGTKGRIGLLVPSVNTVVEPEFNAAIPEGYSIHATRMRNESANVEDSIAMLAHVERAADELGSAHVDVAVFACTASSFVEGTRGEAELRDSIARIAAAPVVTTSDAVREALRSIGARRISMVTPYPSELNALEVDFLNAAGISVLAEVGMGVVDAYSIAEVDTERTVSRGSRLDCARVRRPVPQLHESEDVRDRGRPGETRRSASYHKQFRSLVAHAAHARTQRGSPTPRSPARSAGARLSSPRSSNSL